MNGEINCGSFMQQNITQQEKVKTISTHNNLDKSQNPHSE